MASLNRRTPRVKSERFQVYGRRASGQNFKTLRLEPAGIHENQPLLSAVSALSRCEIGCSGKEAFNSRSIIASRQVMKDADVATAFSQDLRGIANQGDDARRLAGHRSAIDDEIYGVAQLFLDLLGVERISLVSGLVALVLMTGCPRSWTMARQMALSGTRMPSV